MSRISTGKPQPCFALLQETHLKARKGIHAINSTTRNCFHYFFADIRIQRIAFKLLQPFTKQYSIGTESEFFNFMPSNVSLVYITVDLQPFEISFSRQCEHPHCICLICRPGLLTFLPKHYDLFHDFMAGSAPCLSLSFFPEGILSLASLPDSRATP